MSQPEQIAKQSVLPSTIGRGAGGEGVENVTHLRPTVGRITGMVDCKSAGIALDSPGVSLGRKYELASGLMEITYDTGAKVILQGPVTYEVESATGGYLSVGKLTARVENAKQQPAISKFPNLQISKLFVVRTPTAIVTDLGTEFGVEVDTQDPPSHAFFADRSGWNPFLPRASRRVSPTYCTKTSRPRWLAAARIAD